MKITILVKLFICIFKWGVFFEGFSIISPLTELEYLARC
jgi:hypothetical protein